MPEIRHRGVLPKDFREILTQQGRPLLIHLKEGSKEAFMEKLKLPVVKGRTPKSKRLSMDDYIKFVYLNLKYTLDRKANRKSKRQAAVNVPFLL